MAKLPRKERCQMRNTNLMEGDCLELLKEIETGSIDCVITDPPYGLVSCKWDTVIPFTPMWKELNRIIKPNGAIVLFGSEPFSSALRMSNIKNYKYDWIWKKERGVGFQIVKYRPMMEAENVIVFCDKNKSPKYYPVMTPLIKPRLEKFAATKSGSSPLSHLNEGTRMATHRYPKNILEFKRDKSKLHPTQKPVALIEYLIKTYTNENETVLDFTMGSGTTGVAAVNLGRNFIGMELDHKYFEIAQKRIQEAVHEKI